MAKKVSPFWIVVVLEAKESRITSGIMNSKCAARALLRIEGLCILKYMYGQREKGQKKEMAVVAVKVENRER